MTLFCDLDTRREYYLKLFTEKDDVSLGKSESIKMCRGPNSHGGQNNATPFEFPEAPEEEFNTLGGPVSREEKNSAKVAVCTIHEYNVSSHVDVIWLWSELGYPATPSSCLVTSQKQPFATLLFPFRSERPCKRRYAPDSSASSIVTSTGIHGPLASISILPGTPRFVKVSCIGGRKKQVDPYSYTDRYVEDVSSSLRGPLLIRVGRSRKD